jgi:two-component system copper resistance phosphate regulon response regulator CusR
VRILLIEDETKLAGSIAKGLREAECEVDIAADGKAGLERALAGGYDLLIVDVMLPGCDGWQIVEQIRATGSAIPIIFLTARDSVHDRVKGLDLGADDYLVKPFAFAELLARVRSQQRRLGPVQTQHYLRVDDLEIDMRRQRATRSGTALHLTPKEFVLLARLARTPGEVVSRSEILKQVWDIDFEPETNVVDVVVRRLRAKVDDPFDQKLVRTIRGVGYALKTD